MIIFEAVVMLLLVLLTAVGAVYVLSVTESAYRWLPPFVPIPKRVINKVEQLMQLKEGDVFYDLGSGDGRVVRAIARANPTNACLGVERGLLPLFIARMRQFMRPLSHARFLNGNFFTIPLADATHVYMYLLPKTVQELFPRFEKELKPGATIISSDFPYLGRKADEEVVIKGGREHTLYIYKL
jgi:hypothetical protein